MRIEVSFPGGKRVDASFKGFTVNTDQSREDGGEGGAPAPFDLFLASIATCAGIYVLSFCQARNIPAEDIKIVQRSERDPDAKMIKQIYIDILLPAGFPGKYRDAVVRSAELCAVKKHLVKPPEIKISLS